MTQTEFLKAALDKANKSGVYTLDESRSIGECLDSVAKNMDRLKELSESIEKAAQAKAMAAEKTAAAESKGKMKKS